MDIPTELRAALQRANQKSLPDSPPIAQQRNILRERFAHYEETEVFKPGQLLRHKFPSTTNSEVSGVVLFQRYIDNPFYGHERMGNISDPEEIHTISAAAYVDCICSAMRSDKIVVYLFDSSEFRSETAEEAQDL